MAEAKVSLWVMTAECKKHSLQYHAGADEIVCSLASMARAMHYVGNACPGLVWIENVSTSETIEKIDALVRNADGYAWYRVVLDPWKDLGEPVERERAFWVGVRQ